MKRAAQRPPVAFQVDASGGSITRLAAAAAEATSAPLWPALLPLRMTAVGMLAATMRMLRAMTRRMRSLVAT